MFLFSILFYCIMFYVGLVFLGFAILGIVTDITMGGTLDVSNAAHLGGGIAGIILGFYFRRFYAKDPGEERQLTSEEEMREYFEVQAREYGSAERNRTLLDDINEQTAKEEGARVVRRNVFGKYEYVNNQKDAGELEIAGEKPLSRQQATQNAQQQTQEQRKKTRKKDNDSGDNSGDELEIIK